ncbi:hypothetical protein EIP91_008193 [Steccherinum ochraceum]|uniref:Uncharacterized protein n=1 Tax=Steccherinum ochraceum TaxID=92696 RepID=A0A4R0R356_9APHY|nr:hypothetical protein EIP91_008193 [Steccherinum ochraceum]
MRPIAAFFLAALFTTTALAAPVDDTTGSQDQVSEDSHLYRRLTDVVNAVYARGVNDGLEARAYDEHQNRLVARAYGQAPRPYTAPPDAPLGEHKSSPSGPQIHQPQPIRPAQTHSLTKLKPDDIEKKYGGQDFTEPVYGNNGQYSSR